MATASVFKTALQKLQLDYFGSPAELLGQPCIFVDADDHAICETITSVGCGPEEGISLRVSSPTFHELEIKKIVPESTGHATLYTQFDEQTFEVKFQFD